MKQAVDPKDARSFPRALVWAGVAGLVGFGAYRAMSYSEATASDRRKVVKEEAPSGGSSSSMVRTVSQKAPIVFNDREQYATLGKKGLGVPEGGKTAISNEKQD